MAMVLLQGSAIGQNCSSGQTPSQQRETAARLSCLSAVSRRKYVVSHLCLIWTVPLRNAAERSVCAIRNSIVRPR